MTRLRRLLFLLTLVPLSASAQFVGDSLAAAGYGDAVITGAGYASADEFVAHLLSIAETKKAAEAATPATPGPQPPAPAVAARSGVEPPRPRAAEAEQPAGPAYGFAASGKVSTPEEAAAWKAAFLPVGSRLAAPPAGSEVVGGKWSALRYSTGLFFAPEGDGWVVVPAPVGARVPDRPAAALTVAFSETLYHYYNGAFFVWNREGNYAEVVAAPTGIIVTSLPPTAVQADRQGSPCYEYAGTCFEPKFRGQQIVYAVR